MGHGILAYDCVFGKCCGWLRGCCISQEVSERLDGKEVYRLVHSELENGAIWTQLIVYVPTTYIEVPPFAGDISLVRVVVFMSFSLRM